MPLRPPIMLPMAMKRAVIAAIRMAVFIMLNMVTGLQSRSGFQGRAAFSHTP